METKQSATIEPIYYNLSEEDLDYIEEIAGFYGISREDAYLRFLNGNVDGIEVSEDIE